MGILYFVIGYLFGNFQTAYIIGKKFKGEDIRTCGMGNAGASNAFMTYGWKIGVVVGFCDILKAYLALLIAGFISDVFPAVVTFSYLHFTALGVFMGHCHPFLMGFRGGKGTASIIGVLYGLNPIYGLISMLIMLVLTAASGYIVFGTFGMMLYFVYVSYSYGTVAFFISVAIAIFSLYYHIPNLRRIKNGDEKTLKDALTTAKHK